ncbi:SoxR reducing system RseC family protein [Paraglaciecola sp. MB-3u-78]|uniref:SoxR reducing system RseC family protein n=1 Tax=Paraglaciecola sp. MB-3u-78 TaxID=2058332 RepID=UPI000C34571E|nr:SoxR reducing system RseC family protein [Paraglaciecola sp. MB-3u-78]PKH00626.1 transcriptional regulator [Paraglaciecola sp. MB-3u-78]
MIEEIGVICAIEQHNSQQVVIVETQIKSTCGSCEAQSNCGTGAIANVFATKRETLRFRLNEMVEVGQKVSLGIPEENLLKASAMVYCLPLLALVISALIGQTILPLVGLMAEGWLILFTAICSFLTFMFVRRFLSRTDQGDFHPLILKVFPLEIHNIQVKQV